MKASTEKVLLLGAAAGAGYVIYQVHAARKNSGWYWAYVSRETDEQKAAYDEWRKANAGKVAVRKTIEPGLHSYWDVYFKQNRPSIWILFEATKPFTWTLPGKPQPAPKGASTDIKDVQGDDEVLPSIESPNHPWNRFWESFWSDGKDGKDPNPILSTWQALGAAGPIIVYGGTAIILWRLYGALSTSRPSSRGGKVRGLLGA